jgi:hypothetical protein
MIEPAMAVRKDSRGTQLIKRRGTPRPVARVVALKHGARAADTFSSDAYCKALITSLDALAARSITGH